MLFEQLKQTRW